MSRHRLLLICSWGHRTSDIRDSLSDHGIEAQLARVDAEPGLHAALKRGPYDAIVFVRDTAGVPLDLVHTHVLVHAPDTPVVEVDRVSEIGARVGPWLHKN